MIPPLIGVMEGDVKLTGCEMYLLVGVLILTGGSLADKECFAANQND